MSRLEHIPTFDFETLFTDTSTCIRPSVLPPSLEDFCAVYDVFQCVWFRRRRKVEREIQAEGRSKRGPSPSLLPESNTESGERAPKTRRTGTNANTSLVASHPRTAATTATTTTTANDRSTDSPVELSSAHSSTQTQTPPSSVLGLLRETYESASSRDQNSWNIEDNHGESDNDNGAKDSGSPLDFLQDTTTLYPNNNDNNNDSNSKRNNRQPIAAAAAAANGYCSFVLQDDSNHAVTKFTQRLKEWLVTSAGADANATNRLPYSLLFPGPQQTEDHKTTTTTTTTVAGENRNSNNNNNNIRVATVAPHCWIFVGRNRAHTTTNNNSDDDDDRNSLPGRPEHTDAVAHDGTVHVQLEGRKVWHLRPTQELIEQCDENYDVALKTDKDEDNSHYYRVCLEEGDVLVVNTRLWWHRTSIPPQPPPPSSCSPGHRSCCCSVSVARDVYLRDDPTTRTGTATRTGTRRSSSNNDDKNGSGDSYSVGSGSGIEPDESVDDDDDDDDNRLGHKHEREREHEHESMSNVDSSWAKGFIPKGTVLLVDRAPVDDHDDEDGDCSHHGRDADDDDDDDANDDDDDDDANDDNVPARYYDRVPPSIGRTDEKSRANCRLVVRASHEEDDANDETGCKPRGSGDPSSLRQNHDHHPQQQRPTEPKSVPSISKSISISKSKWIALETIRDIREGEEFVLLLLPRGGIEDEDEQP